MVINGRYTDIKQLPFITTLLYSPSRFIFPRYSRHVILSAYTPPLKLLHVNVYIMFQERAPEVP